ncbi:MAG: MerR family transcriptional regulator [Chloroflexi bacterium]|nr:MerR family transcriptional regulator [Chloroflexota bacterium]
MLTIGQLAKKIGVRTSTLRYYEAEGLIMPDGRSDSGYRLYAETAVQRLHLIQRAQRLGFSLAEIRALLQAWQSGNLSDQTIIDTAENRYVALERQITALLTQQHELELFLQDLRHRQNRNSNGSADPAFDEMLARVCANPIPHPPANTLLAWLMEHTNCVLNSDEGQQILDRLRGQHVHIWLESNNEYHILVVSDDGRVKDSLHELTQLEARCQTHTHPVPELVYNDEGYLLIVRGEDAYIFARLFLALEQQG